MKSSIRVLSLASIFTLTGCLGGGSSSSNSSSPSPTPTPSPIAPSVAITAPAANTTTSSTISLSGTCTASVSTVDISGATPTSTSCAANGTFSVSITLSAPTGSKTVTVSQTNSDGTGSNSRVFVLNPSVPSVSITSPTTNTVTASTISLQGSCDSSVSTVDISGAAPTSTACSGGSFNQSVTLSGADGSKTVTASQTNSDGTGSDNRSFILDTTSPASTSISINAGASYTNSTSATLTLAATDSNSGIQMYVTNTSGCASGGSYEAFNASKSWTLGQTNGTATVYVKFKDAVGNESACNSDTIIHDNVAANIAYSSPADGSYGTTGLTVAGTCEDGLTVTVNGSGITATTATCSSGSFSKAVNFTAGEGNKQVTISQTDLASNSTSATRTFVRDNTNPSDITYIAPSSAFSTSSSTYNFQWNAATDNYTVASYKIEIFQNDACTGSPASTVNSQAGTSYNLTLNTGDNTIKVYARDGAGNLSTGLCSSKATKVSPGTLDSNFGTSGKVTTNFSTAMELGYAVAVQSDGKIIVVGEANNASADFAVARYNSDGALDTTFSGDGKLTVDVSAGGVDRAYGVAVQSDGKIVVVGNANGNFGIIRLTSSGSLDTSFSGDGMTTVDFNSSTDISYSVVINSDGTILVGGSAVVSGINNFGVAKFLSNGVLDTTFGVSGKATISFSTGNAEAFAMEVQSDGKIVLGGRAYSGTKYNFAIARMLSDGSLDTGFATSGKLATYVNAASGEETAAALKIQTDGSILLVGRSYITSSYDTALMRVTSVGNLDTTFNSTGRFTLALSAGNDAAQSVQVEPSGNIVVGGYSYSGSNNHFSLIRLASNGTLDVSYGSSGQLLISFSTVASEAYGVLFDTTGRALCAGRAGTDFALARVVQ